MEIKDYYGKVSQCSTCTNHDPEQPMSCNRCFCRGYVAECLACKGKGMVEEQVVGGAQGKMMSTCHTCGGKGIFAVNKPADWDLLHPAAAEAEEGDDAEESEPTSEPLEEDVVVA